MWWMLAREVCILKGQTTRDARGTFRLPDGKEIMLDLYFYRDPEEVLLLHLLNHTNVIILHPTSNKAADLLIKVVLRLRKN